MNSTCVVLSANKSKKLANVITASYHQHTWDSLRRSQNTTTAPIRAHGTSSITVRLRRVFASVEEKKEASGEETRHRH